MEVDDLIKWILTAKSSTRMMDVCIGEFTVKDIQYTSVYKRGDEYLIRYYPGPPGPEYYRLPFFTSKIDDAMSLRPTECTAYLTLKPVRAEASVRYPSGRYFKAKAETAPLAICAAMLKLRSSS